MRAYSTLEEHAAARHRNTIKGRRRFTSFLGSKVSASEYYRKDAKTQKKDRKMLVALDASSIGSEEWDQNSSLPAAPSARS